MTIVHCPSPHINPLSPHPHVHLIRQTLFNGQTSDVCWEDNFSKLSSSPSESIKPAWLPIYLSFGHCSALKRSPLVTMSIYDNCICGRPPALHYNRAKTMPIMPSTPYLAQHHYYHQYHYGTGQGHFSIK